MTFLAFNEYTKREYSSFSMDVEGGMNLALLLMVVVGFLGASLATRDGGHIAIDDHRPRAHARARQDR